MVIRSCIPSFEPIQELPTIKTLEDARQTCPLCFAQHQLSSAKLTNIRVSLGEKRAQWNLWFWRMGRLLKPWLLNTWKAGKCSAQDGSPLRVLAASVPQSRDHSKLSYLSWFDAPRAHQKTHPQLWRHPAAPLTCFKRRTLHACKILQNIKTLKTSSRHLETVPWPLLRWSSNKQPCGIRLGASCHLINLQSWKVELKQPPLESVPDRCQPAQHCIHTGLVQNTLNPNLAVSNFVAEGPWKQPLWIAGSDLVSLMFLHGGIQTLGKSEGTECTSTL